MNEQHDHETGALIDHQVLPPALPGETDQFWDERAREIMQTLNAASVWPSAWSLLARAWKPTALLAAAAAVILLLLGGRASAPAQRPDSETLSIVAAAGNPYALWARLERSGDPLLALIALGEQIR